MNQALGVLALTLAADLKAGVAFEMLGALLQNRHF